MIYIKLPERLKNVSAENRRNVITSDETWAFTEQPRSDMSGDVSAGISPHDLFYQFTAGIIRKNTLFTR